MNKDLVSVDDYQLLKSFEECKLGTDCFDHQTHVRIGWMYLQLLPKEAAITKMTHQLQKFVTSKGVADKYHHTLTIASMHIIHHYQSSTPHSSFHEFITQNEQLVNDFKTLIQVHYSPEIFTSTVARKTYIEPEKLPFC